MPTRRNSRSAFTAPTPLRPAGLLPAAPARVGVPPPRPGQFAAPVPAASASPSNALRRRVLLDLLATPVVQLPGLAARVVDRGVLWPPPGRPPRPEGERRRSRRP